MKEQNRRGSDRNKGAFSLHRMLFPKRKITVEKKREFYYMLEFYLHSKMPLMEALDLVYDDMGIEGIIRLKERIRNGNRLVDALQEVGLTDDFIFSCLLIGENTGNYSGAFYKIVHYLEQKEMDRKYFLRITAYPCFLLLMIVLILSFVIFVVSPQLYKTISGIGMKMPPTLAGLYAVYQFVINYRSILLFGLIAAGCILLSGLFNRRVGRRMRRFLVKRRWIFAFYRTAALRSIFWQLEVLFSSKMDLVSALRIVSQNADFLGYPVIMQKVAQGIRHGKSMHEMLRQFEDYFPKAVITYIKIGENTDTMEENLKNAVRFLSIRADEMAENTKKMIQPMMIIIAGVLISLLLALVLPIINSATNLGGLQ